MTDARFRFYEQLNNFLPPTRRKKEFQAPLADQATVKQAIEALGVPHTEVELILVDGCSVDFAHRLRGGERIAVYPKFETLDITPLLRVRPAPMREPRFVADAHLGGLARLLRLAGFDTLFENDYADDVLVSLAIDQGRIILSRDRELLKRRKITHGCYVRALNPSLQFSEIVERLELNSRMRPFSRCLVCNGSLHPIRKASVIDRLPPAVALHHEEFSGCDGCGRIYWAGSHWRRMRAIITSLAQPSADPT
jgi:uncharacterized protein with PIN domain